MVILDTCTICMYVYIYLIGKYIRTIPYIYAYYALDELFLLIHHVVILSAGRFSKQSESCRSASTIPSLLKANLKGQHGSSEVNPQNR